MTGDRSETIRQSFVRQAKACADLGSPFTARLCTLAAERLTDDNQVGATVLGWPATLTAPAMHWRSGSPARCTPLFDPARTQHLQPSTAPCCR